MGLAVIDELGGDLEKRWSERDYDSACFVELSTDRLSAARVHERVDPDQIVQWALRGPLPEQADPQAKFGQPPITLFRSRRFFIDALFWVDGTTSIHDHSFSGAFQVLAGSSIETTFQFSETRNIGGHLRFGTLGVRGTEFLRQGDIRPIVAGPTMIHSLFHLPRPAVSLVVRTYHDVAPGIQLAYLPPGIAHNAFHVDETLDRILQVVEMLRVTEHPDFEARTGELIARSDLHTAFSVIRTCLKIPDRGRLERLIERVRDRDAQATIRDWTVAAERIRFLQSRRTMVHDADLRFMLAVLLNAHRRVDALALVAAHTPESPAPRQVASWLSKLSAVTARLQLASGPWEPSLLGLPTITPRLEDVLATELAGQGDVRTDDEAAFLDKLRTLPPLLPLFR